MAADRTVQAAGTPPATTPRAKPGERRGSSPCAPSRRAGAARYPLRSPRRSIAPQWRRLPRACWPCVLTSRRWRSRKRRASAHARVDFPLQPIELGRLLVARALEVDGEFLHDAAGLSRHDEHAIREIHGFFDAVGDEERRFGRLRP